MKLMLKSVAKHFGIGLAAVLPFAFAIWVVIFVVTSVDSLVGEYFYWPGIHIPGLGFVAVLVFITLIGLLSRIYISRVVFHWADLLFTKTPIVKSLYTLAKELIDNVTRRRNAFKEPVLVEWPDERALVLGFVTSEKLPQNMDSDGSRVSVYLPNAFQFAGATVIVQRDRIKPCGLTVEQAFKFALSAGLGQPTETQEEETPTGENMPTDSVERAFDV